MLCGTKQPPKLRGLNAGKTSIFLLLLYVQLASGVWGGCSCSSHSGTQADDGSVVVFAYVGKGTWRIVQWFLKLLPRSDACHFHSHFIGQWMVIRPGLNFRGSGKCDCHHVRKYLLNSIMISTVNVMKNIVNICWVCTLSWALGWELYIRYFI